MSITPKVSRYWTSDTASARGDKKRSKLMTLITVASTDGQRP